MRNAYGIMTRKSFGRLGIEDNIKMAIKTVNLKDAEV